MFPLKDLLSGSAWCHWGARVLGVVSAALLLVAAPSFVAADSISPEVVEADIRLEEKMVIQKTVTVEAGPPTRARLDVVFLSDTTSSMGEVIAQVQRNAVRILGELAELGDLRAGVAEYRDTTDSFSYRINTPLTSDTAAVRRGLNQWRAEGGGDTPEANLYGLHETARQMRWRDQSARVILWFGDAPGHDPSVGVSLGSTISRLNGREISVHAIDSGSLDSTGQARRITQATGGRRWSVDGTSGVVRALLGAVESALENYSEVKLDFGEEPLGLGITITPESYTGAFKRDRDRTYEFEMTLEAFKPGLYEFDVDALVDGAKAATEKDKITVPNLPPIRE